MIDIEVGDGFDLLRGLPDRSVDLILTDPPYGVNHQNRFTTTRPPQAVLAGDDGSVDYEVLASLIKAKLRPDGAYIVFTGWARYPIHYEQFRAAGLRVQHPLLFQKRNGSVGDLRSSFASNAEWALFGTGPSFAFQSTKLMRNIKAGASRGPGRTLTAEYKVRFPACWFGPEYPNATENPNTVMNWPIRHPTAKTAQLMSWLIQIASPPGGLVVDPFLGSGSTALAARQTGRQLIGCDLEPRFIELAQWRLKENR